MMVPFKVILLILSTFALANCERRIQRMTYNNQVRTYVYREINTDFHGTVTWCKSLGGKLPSIHSQEDIDWIAKAVGRTLLPMYYHVWLGMKRKIVDRECQFEWMDGTPYDYQLSWHRRCEEYRDRDDGAMVMCLDRDFPEVETYPVYSNRRSVCVLEHPAPVSEKRVHRTVSGNQLWTYVSREGALANFDWTTNWCKSLGGQLPSIHSQEDADFIKNVVNDTSVSVWLGMKRVMKNGKFQLNWMDETPYDHLLSWADPHEWNTFCKGDNCGIALHVNEQFPKVYPIDTEDKRSVCVIKSPPIEEQMRYMEASTTWVKL